MHMQYNIVHYTMYSQHIQTIAAQLTWLRTRHRILISVELPETQNLSYTSSKFAQLTVTHKYCERLSHIIIWYVKTWLGIH